MTTNEVPPNQAWIITTSFNKGKYLPELRAALEAQTDQNFMWWIMDNSTDAATRELVLSWKDAGWIKVTTHDYTDEERRERFIHPVLLNQALAEAPTGDYFIHMSDDDLPYPRFLETLVGFLIFNRDKDACYTKIRWTTLEEDGSWEVRTELPPAPVIFGPKIDPFGQDGNSMLFSLEALRSLGEKPWPEDWDGADCCDGQMLRSFCKEHRIWPASTVPLMDHRTTELSAFNNSIMGRRATAEEIYNGKP